jgi:hypothetical protein
LQITPDLTWEVMFETMMLQTLNLISAAMIVVLLVKLLIKEQMAVGRVLA